MPLPQSPPSSFNGKNAVGHRLRHQNARVLEDLLERAIAAAGDPPRFDYAREGFTYKVKSNPRPAETILVMSALGQLADIVARMVLVRLVPLRTQRSLNKRGSIGGHGAGLTTYAADPLQDEEALRSGSIALPSLSSNSI